jgi:enamine deaminase RidA (YjgF/YER057c/UK114 family)
MDLTRLAERGYDTTPGPLQLREFHAATRTGSLVFTSGHTSVLGDLAIRGRVGSDVDLPTARRAAEICAVNCLRAALAVAEAEEIVRVVKVLGMVNVAEGFTQTPAVIDGATELLNAVFAGQPSHARSAVGMVLPGNAAVEVELILELAT